MEWSSTDQFGNLMASTSSARSHAELESDLAEMAAAVFERHPDAALTFCIDVAYGEVAAPGADCVSHVMAVPWFAERLAAGESAEDIFDQCAQLLAAAVGSNKVVAVVPEWE